MRVLSALDALKGLVSQHVDAIDNVVAPILDERDIISTCERYQTLIRDDRFPREYGSVRAILDSELTTEPRREAVRDKVKAVLSELGRFQHAAFMLEYDSWRMSDYVESARELWSLLAERDHLQSFSRITQLQTEVRKGFEGSFQWLIEEQEWVPDKQRQLVSIPHLELNTPDEVVDFVRTWFRQWQRHVQKTLYGGSGLDYAITQLGGEYEHLALAEGGMGTMADNPSPQFLSDLRKGIVQCFGTGDLKVLCADLGIDYENLGGEGKETKALDLISYMDRRGQITKLLEYCISARPEYTWPQADVSQRPSDQIREGRIANARIVILFLAANPKDTAPLRLDEEMRAIDQALLQAEYRDRFEIKQQWAVRVADIQGHLLHHQPDIVHFSGHGSTKSEIMLEDDSGTSRPVSVRALSQLFSILRDNIKCVVLNACYSEPQAKAIAEHIDCVVGMSMAIGDKAAINFAAAFYQALGYGRDVKTAFDLGCAQINLEGLDEQDTPKLLAQRGDPEKVVFVHISKESMHKQAAVVVDRKRYQMEAPQKEKHSEMKKLPEKLEKMLQLLCNALDDVQNLQIDSESVAWVVQEKVQKVLEILEQIETGADEDVKAQLIPLHQAVERVSKWRSPSPPGPDKLEGLKREFDDMKKEAYQLCRISRQG